MLSNNARSALSQSEERVGVLSAHGPCLTARRIKASRRFLSGVSESPPGWSSIYNLGHCSRLEHSVQSRRRHRRHAMATKGPQSIQNTENTCTASNNVVDVGSHCDVVCKSDAQDRDVLCDGFVT